MGDLLYRVSPRDPEAFGLAFVAMMVVAAVACVLPAWRAMGADPMRVLKG
jgi:ABC-type lipoprotein release transport system permease subunit